jgi:hypothetical protein
MSEWWTYAPTDFLMFSARTYYRLFELYNAAVWPLQVAAFALGVAILMLIVRERPWSGRAIAAILGALWLFVAWAYLFERYDTINWAGRYLAIGFTLEAALLAWTGIVRDRLRFDLRRIGKIGLAVAVFVVVLSPLIAPLSGRPWTQAELFGLAPDPTAIATLGVLLAANRAHWHLLVIPLIWCTFSALTLWTMEQQEAWVVALFAAPAFLLTAMKPRRHPPPPPDG